MPKNLALSFVVLSICFSGCLRHAYYLNAFNANNNYYNVIPLRSDSIKAASYAGAVLTAGGANEDLNDNVYSFHASFQRSHQSGIWQAYYSADLAAGCYTVNKYDEATGSGVNADLINSRAGNKFFGGYGIKGGINMVLPFAQGGEWRVLGLETSLENEFGSYLKFRRELPNNAADIISRNGWFTTVGLTSDILLRLHEGSIGYKIAGGTSLQKTNGYVAYTEKGYVLPWYVTQTLHYTSGRWTGFGQVNIATFASNVQLGMIYRLSKNKASD